MKALLIILSLCFALTACEKKTDVEQLQQATIQSMSETYAANPEQHHIIINDLTLIHETGNKYVGMLTTSEHGQAGTYSVEVVADGETLYWTVKP